MSTLDVLKSRKAPVEAVLTRKAGSKLLMNLFYYFDHKKYEKNPFEIETNSDLRWSTATPIEEKPNLIRVALFRNPVNRFIAFYFESIYNQTSNSWSHWQSDLQARGFNFEAGRDIAKHQANVNLLLDYLGEKTARIGLYELPSQIAPQVKTVLPAQDAGFDIIDYSKLNIELTDRLSDHYRNINKCIGRIANALEIATPIDKIELLTPAQRERVRKLYAIDFDYYEAMRYGTT